MNLSLVESAMARSKMCLGAYLPQTLFARRTYPVNSNLRRENLIHCCCPDIVIFSQLNRQEDGLSQIDMDDSARSATHARVLKPLMG